MFNSQQSKYKINTKLKNRIKKLKIKINKKTKYKKRRRNHYANSQ